MFYGFGVLQRKQLNMLMYYYYKAYSLVKKSSVGDCLSISVSVKFGAFFGWWENILAEVQCRLTSMSLAIGCIISITTILV